MVSYMDSQYRQTGKRGRYCTEARHLLQQEMPWFKDIPAHILYGAMRDAERDYKLVIRNRSKGEAHKLPRCRKRTQRSFFMLGNAVTPKGFYPRLLGQMRATESLPYHPADCRVVFEAGKFWLRYPEVKTITQSENQGRVVAVDPGVRTFATLYSPSGIGKIGHKAFGRIQRLAYHLDDLISRTTKEGNRQRKQRMRLAQARLRLRIRNLVDTLHYQTAGWLCRNFDVVVFPEGDFTNACAKAQRKIRSRAVRTLLGYAFARFRERLKFKAGLLGKQVVIVNEAYTSKTHNITGEVRQIGGAKTITSKGIRIDRDVNGALGILLKALLAQPSEQGALLAEGNIK